MPITSTPGAIAPSPREVAAIAREIFGDALLGAYLYGSATLGGLRKHSDIDVMGILGRRTSDSERRALVERLLEVSGARARRGPRRPVELVLVVHDDVRPWRYPPRCEFMYGEWLRDDFERGTIPDPAESADLAMLISMVVAGGQPLFGPPAGELLGPIPAADLRRAIVDSLPALLADLETDRNVPLTLSRMWMTMDTGRIEPKGVAAEWATERLPGCLRAPLADARAWYSGETPERDRDVQALRAFAAHVVRRIRRAYRRHEAEP